MTVNFRVSNLNMHAIEWVIFCFIVLCNLYSCMNFSLKQISYYAYGSNMKLSILQSRGVFVKKYLGAGILENHRLAFPVKGIPHVEPSFASVVLCQGESVHGALFSLAWPYFFQLLNTEGVPLVYRPYLVNIKPYANSNMTVKAWTLRSVSGPFQFQANENVTPSRSYLRLLMEGAREVGLEQEYCAKLKGLYESATVQGVGRSRF